MKFVIIAAMSIIWLVGCNNFLPPQQLKKNDIEIAKEIVPKLSNTKLEATYESVKANIIDQKCLSCHKAGTGKKGEDLPLETKDQIINGTLDDGSPLIVQGKAIESPLYLVLLEDKKLRGNLKLMPPVKALEEKIVEAVSKEEMDVLAAWINGSIVVTEPPQSQDIEIEKPKEIQNEEVIDFAFIKSKILEPKCIKCHKPGGKVEEIPFDTRQDILIGSNDVGESIIVLGKPEASLLYLSLLPNKEDRKGARKMPTLKSIQAGEVQDITPEEAKLIETWIKNGAP